MMLRFSWEKRQNKKSFLTPGFLLFDSQSIRALHIKHHDKKPLEKFMEEAI